MQTIGLLDGHVHDVVLAVFPRLDMGIFVHDQRAEVAAVEHHDVRGAGLGIEVFGSASYEYILILVVDSGGFLLTGPPYQE